MPLVRPVLCYFLNWSDHWLTSVSKRMNEHKKYMTRCLELGRASMELGNAPVGAVLVHNGEIVGEGLELGKTKNDITYHAEIEAIRDALRKQNVTKLSPKIASVAFMFRFRPVSPLL